MAANRSIFSQLHPLRGKLRDHFIFEVDGVSVAYCYIRKNACSAFKRLMLDQAGYTGEFKGSLQFLLRQNSAASLRAVRSADWRIFVHRDPFDRLASLYRNKLVMLDRAVDFIASYRKLSGAGPDNATFEQFVRHYLHKRNVDPHARSEASHLLPVSYNCVSTLETLHDDMAAIFGERIARTYFRKPFNSSSEKLYDDPSVDIPAIALRKRFEVTGGLPSTSALRTPDLEAVIRHLYRADYLIEPRSPGAEAGA